MISITILIAAGLTPTAASKFAEPLAAACARFEINTPRRVAGLIGQCMVESARFTATEENLRYRAEPLLRVFPSRVRTMAEAQALVANGPQAIANRVYASKNGNGDEASGDGWRFRGRGLIQLTGRANYAAAAEATGQAYLEQPDLVALPPDACLTAAWYWAKAGCNQFADALAWDRCTRLVNGAAMLHREERAAASALALEALAP